MASSTRRKKLRPITEASFNACLTSSSRRSMRASDQPLNRVGKIHLVDRFDQPPRVLAWAPHQNAVSHQRADDLLDEERIALGLSQNLLAQRPRADPESRPGFRPGWCSVPADNGESMTSWKRLSGFWDANWRMRAAGPSGSGRVTKKAKSGVGVCEWQKMLGQLDRATDRPSANPPAAARPAGAEPTARTIAACIEKPGAADPGRRGISPALRIRGGTRSASTVAR